MIMAICKSLWRKLKKLSVFFVAVCISIVLLANVFMSLSLFEQHCKPQIVRFADRGIQSENSRHVNEDIFEGIPKATHITSTHGTKARDFTTKNVNTSPSVLVKEKTRKSQTTQKISRTEKPRKVGNLDQDYVDDSCPENEITKKYKSSKVDGKIACQPHKPSQEACKFAEKLYPFNKTLLDCPFKFSVEFCSIDAENKISCRFPSTCERITVRAINNETGLVHIKGSFAELDELELGISKIIDRSTFDGFRFVFIDCVGDDIPPQFLSWVENLNHETTRRSKREKINVNIAWLDSISRAHFYRSLPLVIEEFKRQNKQRNSPAEILDFSLFQSVEGHTAQNLRALLTGQLFPESITEQEKAKAPVGVELLYGMFKKAGYKTLYQDDLCWTSVWGMRKELGIPGTWKKFHKLISLSNIDDTGLAFASCEILKYNGLKNPFSESKDNQICFNNKFQHDYILEYSAMFHENANTPTMSYTCLNTAHDWHGIKTQTLNKGLVNYVRRMSKSENTITILMADHGNTYTPFVRKILEGRYEMYHPSFFMIVPERVATILGSEAMESLRANQNRLFTMLDVHYGLKSIAHLSLYGVMPAENRGLLSKISKERTCNDIEWRLPNLCVCDGWDSEAANDTQQVSVLEFGVGMLNNQIDDQRRQYYEKSDNKNEIMQSQKCLHLVPMYFRNVRERNDGDNLITVLDFIVKSGKGIDQEEEIFHVEIQSVIKPGVLRNYMKLLSFDRLSRYGPYEKCADEGVDVRLCVCSLAETIHSEERISVATLWKLMPKLPSIHSKPMLYSKVNGKCIYLVARYYHEEKDGKIDKTSLQTSTLEALNICQNSSFSVEVNVKPSLMKISTSTAFRVSVYENTLKFLCVLATENLSWPTSFKFTYTVREIT